MGRQVFVLSHPQARSNALHAVSQALANWIVEVREPVKSRDQEAMYHALFAEIAKTREFMGERQDAETWKRLLVDAFARIKAAEGDHLPGHGKIIPNLDGTGFVQLGVQTRRFSKRHATEFIEFLHAWMADSEVSE